MTENLSNQEAIWQVEGVRFTAFPLETFKAIEYDWWESLCGEPPETRMINPRNGTIHEEGKFENGIFTVDVAPFRLDYKYSVPNRPPDSDKLSTLGDLDNVIEKFNVYVNKLINLDKITDLQRLAFGAILFQQVDSKKAGYEILSKYLPFRIEADKVSDLFFQINRPRNSLLETTLLLNRLTKWSVGAIDLVALELSRSGEKTTTKSFSTTNLIYAVRLELDINTSPEYQGPFKKKDILPIFEELIDLGKVTSRKGDLE